MDKKPYEAPAVQKVKFSIVDATLANCHSSPNLTPRTEVGIVIPCGSNQGCFNAP